MYLLSKQSLDMILANIIVRYNGTLGFQKSKTYINLNSSHNHEGVGVTISIAWTVHVCRPLSMSVYLKQIIIN